MWKFFAKKEISPQERLEKWNEAICAQKSSVLTIEGRCAENGINPNIYYYYLRRIRDALLKSSGPRLVEMKTAAEDAIPQAADPVFGGFHLLVTIHVRDSEICIGESASPELKSLESSAFHV